MSRRVFHLSMASLVVVSLAVVGVLASALVPDTTCRAYAESASPTITVVAVGDLLFDSAPKRLINAEGGKAPFTKVAKRLKVADVAVGNLECPISTRGTALAGKTFTFRGTPKALTGLKYAGFDLLSLANNHVKDYGSGALADTFGYLKRNGLSYAGAGRDKKAAFKPVIIERKGAKIAYLAFSEIGPSSFAATSSRSGTAFVTTGNFAAVTKAIKAATKQADYVIVSFHWGIEKDYTPTGRQVREGRAAITAGADMVLSHHPHVIQGVEFYKKGLIAYSLGNFVFSPGSAAGRDSMILSATLTSKGVSKVSARPVWIGYNGRPLPTAKGSPAQSRIIKRIKSTSRGRGTKVTVSGVEAKLSR